MGRVGNIIKEHLLQSAEGLELNRRELEAAIEQRQAELRVIGVGAQTVAGRELEGGDEALNQ